MIFRTSPGGIWTRSLEGIFISSSRNSKMIILPVATTDLPFQWGINPDMSLKFTALLWWPGIYVFWSYHLQKACCVRINAATSPLQWPSISMEKIGTSITQFQLDMDLGPPVEAPTTDPLWHGDWLSEDLGTPMAVEPFRPPSGLRSILQAGWCNQGVKVADFKNGETPFGWW